MIFKAFRIKNYRSIVDTGWIHLSPDMITALIGQNESGKTSVLEALKSFYDGIITDDILRSDLKMPEISCLFDLENENEYPGKELFFPKGVIEKIREAGSIELTRYWEDIQNSSLILNGDEIKNLYGDIDSFWEELETQILNAYTDLADKRDALAEEAELHGQQILNNRDELGKLMRRAGELEKQLRKTSGDSKKDLLENETKQIGAEVLNLEQQIENTGNELKKINDSLLTNSATLSIANTCLELKDKTEQARKKVDYAFRELDGSEKMLDNARSKSEVRNATKTIEHLRNIYIQSANGYDLLMKDLKLKQLSMKYLLEGAEVIEAERKARVELIMLEKIITREHAALLFFENIPHFELFEDFSSLLPNRIDLEDLFLEHTNAEGYKAVKNFLIIAGLAPEFFTQTNNRILKQKIENLNNELTLNFQDYWGQRIGKTNKIQIAFELEHYDFQNPDKKGKPYLEFWIKDEHERLYPKQRSRGVRWFLSFYLELKASAKKHAGRKRTLLIDEPALSLHARAQEDVLKVFEDIKDKLQVIYTTHSPHMIDLTKLFRILAVQRSHNTENSETVIFNSGLLHTAAQDTLSPIYSLMGVRMSQHEFIKQKNNILVENTACYYYLSAMLPLAGLEKEVSFLPATGSQSLHLLSNLMLGWGLDYHILVFDNAQDRKYTAELEKTLIPGKEGENNKILQVENIAMVEDLFSTLDFKKFILQKRIGISESNSEHIFEKNLSRVLLASSFTQMVKNNKLKFSDFDEETKSNFKKLAQRVNSLLA